MDEGIFGQRNPGFMVFSGKDAETDLVYSLACQFLRWLRISDYYKLENQSPIQENSLVWPGNSKDQSGEKSPFS